MRELVAAMLVLAGAAFMLLAALGVLRLPDLFTRMQAATKAGAVGAGSLLLALAVVSADVTVTLRAMLIAGFIVLTAPVAAHVVARVAYNIGVPLWERTLRDQLREARGPARLPPDE